jgi:hypothetical protein
MPPLSPGTRCALTAPFHPYPAERGGMFSVALSVGSPLPRVTRHTALWSSDFPQSRKSGIAIAWSTPASLSYQTAATQRHRVFSWCLCVAVVDQPVTLRVTGILFGLEARSRNYRLAHMATGKCNHPCFLLASYIPPLFGGISKGAAPWLVIWQVQAFRHRRSASGPGRASLSV